MINVLHVVIMTIGFNLVLNVNANQNILIMEKEFAMDAIIHATLVMEQNIAAHHVHSIA